MRILVIDDDLPTVELLSQTLLRDGHTVETETSGSAGRDRAVAEPFDLILCDIGLPDVNGFALARQIRQAGVDARLLALSGYTSDQDRSLGLASGFDSYLTKPITASVLLEEVRFQGSRPRSPQPRATAAPRRRGVLGGLVVMALGVPFALQPLGVPGAASYLFVAMGAAFLISYARGRQYVYLIPMVTLVSFGVAQLLPTWISMRPEAVAPAFVGVIAVGFVVSFALAPRHRWLLVPAVLLGAAAAGELVTGASLIPTSLEPFLVPVVLIGVGAYLLAEPRS